MTKTALSLGFLSLAATLVHAQGVGTSLPPIELQGLAQSGAASFSDFYGQAVLIEFFAYW